MNAFGIKIFFATLIGVLVNDSAWAGPATPVKYCESLAATSCEVLNIEMGSCIGTSGCAGLIKYCRNQKFQAVPMYYTMGSSDVFARFWVGSSQVANSSVVNPSGATAMNSTTLCSIIP